MNSPVILILAIAGYLLASFMLLMRFARTFKAGFLANFIYIASAAAVIAHGFLLHRTIFTGNGLDLGFYNALSLMAWVAAVIGMLTALVKPINSLLLLIIYPLAILLLLLQNYLHDPGNASGSPPFGMQFHIVLSIISYSLLAIAALQSCMLYVQEYALRNKRFTKLFNILPPMQFMESLLVQLIIIGFFLLSLSLASGLMFVSDIFDQHLSHKTVFSLCAWCIYGVLLWGRWSAGWRGITIVKWTLGGFFLLLLAYFGSKMVLELILQRV